MFYFVLIIYNSYKKLLQDSEGLLKIFSYFKINGLVSLFDSTLHSELTFVYRTYSNMEWIIDFVISYQKRLFDDECMAYAKWLSICDESWYISRWFWNFSADYIENVRFYNTFQNLIGFSL